MEAMAVVRTQHDSEDPEDPYQAGYGAATADHARALFRALQGLTETDGGVPTDPDKPLTAQQARELFALVFDATTAAELFGTETLDFEKWAGYLPEDL